MPLQAVAQQPAAAPGWRRMALTCLLGCIDTLVKCGGTRLTGDAPQVRHTVTRSSLSRAGVPRSVTL